MILLDTGPLVALFDPRDGDHERCRETLRGIGEPLITTAPVLTEVFHLLNPASRGALAVRDFFERSGARLWFMNDETLLRAFGLMSQYADQPMDFADASLVTAAEALRITKIFSIDRRDFAVYRARIGRSNRAFQVIG